MCELSKTTQEMFPLLQFKAVSVVVCTDVWVGQVAWRQGKGGGGFVLQSKPNAELHANVLNVGTIESVRVIRRNSNVIPMKHDVT